MGKDKGKEKVEEDEEVAPTPDPPLVEEPFLKALIGKALEGISIFTGKMDVEKVMEWIDGMENHFECDDISEARLHALSGL